MPVELTVFLMGFVLGLIIADLVQDDPKDE